MALATRRIKSVKQTKILKLSQNEKEMNVAKCSKNGFCCSCDSRIYNDDGALTSLQVKTDGKKRKEDTGGCGLVACKVVENCSITSILKERLIVD